jgi:hypothetical protein
MLGGKSMMTGLIVGLKRDLSFSSFVKGFCAYRQILNSKTLVLEHFLANIFRNKLFVKAKKSISQKEHFFTFYFKKN